MWAAEMTESTGIKAWITNSQIVHAVAEFDTPTHFERREVVMPVFAHEPTVSRAPTGEWVMYFTTDFGEGKLQYYLSLFFLVLSLPLSLSFSSLSLPLSHLSLSRVRSPRCPSLLHDYSSLTHPHHLYYYRSPRQPMWRAMHLRSQRHLVLAVPERSAVRPCRRHPVAARYADELQQQHGGPVVHAGPCARCRSQ